MARFRILDDEEEQDSLSTINPRFREATEEAELSFKDIHGDMPWYQTLAIGAGRGVSDVLEGIKQNALMISDPEAAEAYTEKVNEDIRLYQEGIGKEHPVLSTVGRIAGTAGPLAAFAPAGWAGAAGLGALEGAAMFTPEASMKQKAANALVGGTLAGGTQAAINSLWRLPKASTSQAADAVQTAAERGVGLRPQDISENQVVNLVGAIGEAGIGSRSRGAPGARGAADWLLDQTKESGSLLDSARRSIEANATKQNELYGTLSQFMGEAHVRVNPKLIRQQAQELIDEQLASGLPNNRIMKQLQKVIDAVPEGNSFASWKQFRTQLADQMINWNKKGVSTAPLKRIYGQVTENLRATAAAAGDDALQMFDEANALTTNIHALRMSPAGRLVDKGEASRLEGLLRGGGASKESKEAAHILYNVLDPAGQEGGRHILLNQALDSAMDAKGRFFPSKFAKNLKGVRERTEVFFKDSPGLLDEIRKIENLMAHAKDPSKAGVLAKFFIPGGVAGVGGTVGGTLGGAEGAVLGGQLGFLASETLLPYMTRSRSVNALVDALAKTKPGSQMSKSLMAELYRIAQAAPGYGVAAAATQPQAPMTIDIRNGVPQQ